MEKNHAHLFIDKVIKLFYAILILSPVLIDAYLIFKYAVNVLYWDDWMIAGFLIKYYQGDLSILDFFVQHNEHRMFFPLLINFIVSLFTDLNTVYEIYISIIILVATLCILYIIYRKEYPKISLLYFIPIPWVIFSLRQYGNFLWGFEDCIYLCIFCVIVSLYLLIYTKAYPGLSLAIISALVASFSFLNGLLIWPLGLCAMLISKRKRSDLIIWGISAISATLAFFWGWNKPTHIESIFNFANISDLIDYFLVVTGSPLGQYLDSSKDMGLLMVFLIAVTAYLMVKNGLIQKHNIFICISLFSIGSSAMNAIGRAGWGLYNAFESRYTPFGLLLPVSLYFISLGIFTVNRENTRLKRHGSFIFGAISVLIVIGLLIGNAQGYDGLVSRNILGTINDDLIFDQYYLLSYKYQPDENLEFLLPYPSLLRSMIPELERLGLSVFNDEVPPDSCTISDQFTLSYIDKINSQLITNNSTVKLNQDLKSIQVEGWAVDTPGGSLARSVYVSIDGKVNIPALYHLKREDVSDYLKNPGLEYSGYLCSFSPSLLDNGTHDLRLKIISHDGKEMYLSQNVTIFVEK